MSPPRIRRWIPLLAFLSGAPALVYQVVWTREVALLAGSQVEAVSVVLVAFFGGLAAGAHVFGALCDRVTSPLRLYAGLEIAAGALAALSTLPLRALGAGTLASGAPLLLASGALLLPITFLLGGSLPALLRAAARDPAGVAGPAGRIVGANTAGAVGGVSLSVLLVPTLGLRASTLWAGGAAVAVGLAALALAPRGSRPERSAASRAQRPPGPVLLAAALVGAATLGYEVLAARLAALQLGSSLYAWAQVLGLFLTGLAAGNLALARRAARSATPALDLGWLELAAASALVLGSFALRPELAMPAPGLSARTLLAVAAGVLPAAFLMGAAFPFLVGLAVRGPRVGAAFGALSAVNTAGGIAGALLAPFVLLPGLGLIGAVLACAVLNALVGLAFLAWGAQRRRARRLALGALVLAAACAPLLAPRAPAASPWVLFVADGRQATAVVAQLAGHRSLLVDGDPEAATAGDARRTEELLAALPLLLHPEPRRFLEVGLGSGITLGTAGRFPLERLECVEIAPAVLRAAPFFEPDNRGVARQGPARIALGDARIFLARHPSAYDVVAANTLHPWSLGATGLYSREYFERLAGALRPGGLAVQWLPAARIGADSLALILRSFFAVFPEGGLWWGAGNLIAVGARQPLAPPSSEQIAARMASSGLDWQRIGLTRPGELAGRRIADAATLRAALGPGETLSDDRPVLELRAARRRGGDEAALFQLLAGLARAGARADPAAGPLQLWLESLAARAEGDSARAEGREALAEAAGFAEAGRARGARLAAAGQRDFAAGRLSEAEADFRGALAADPRQREARFGLAGLAIHRGALETADAELVRLLEQHPDDAPALNELASLRYRRGEVATARRLLERALEANPFYLEALANAGLIAAADGDPATARQMLERLHALGPLGVSPEERTLAEALAGG